MLFLGDSLCIFGYCCGWNKRNSGNNRYVEFSGEDGDGKLGLSEAGTVGKVPPSGGEKVRKFKFKQHGFRGRGKHGETHMIHEISNQGGNKNSFASFEMAETRRKKLQELVKRSGNNTCAECGKKSKSYLFCT